MATARDGANPPARVTEHVAAFNVAVTTGDWPSFADRFTDDARMSFHGVPAGPFIGRDAIREAYSGNPPDDTLTVTDVESADDVDHVSFRWHRGGTGSMRLHWRAGLVASLDAIFDR